MVQLLDDALPIAPSQVLAPSGEWVNTQIGEDVVAVFPGYTLSHLTAGAIHPAKRRVVRPHGCTVL